MKAAARALVRLASRLFIKERRVEGGRQQALAEQYAMAKATMRLRRGQRLLSRYRLVISDRLHVHILCTLLGVPNVLLDNSYGKVSGFVDTFSTEWRDARKARDLSEALGWLKDPSTLRN
jgi:pyruvyl transferase EpsO